MLFEKQPSISIPSVNGTIGSVVVDGNEKWYVAYVRTNCKRRVAESINKVGYTS
jgi:hypothetical protein